MEILEILHFSPQYGDWSSALVSIFFGLINIIITISFGIFGFYKWKKENLLIRKQRKKAIEAEIDENFHKNIKWYFDLIEKLEEFDLTLLTHDFKDIESLNTKMGDKKSALKLKSIVFQILNVLEIIYSFSKESIKYEKTWKKHFSFIFKQTIFKTAFYKLEKEFDEDFCIYVNSIINDKQLNKLVVLSDLSIERNL